MVSLIVFGIIALVVIVFLLSFNIKTISRPADTVQIRDLQGELPVNSAPLSQAEWTEKQSTKGIDNKSPMSDNQYRQALRQFNSSPGKKSPIPQDRLNDSAYRNAARSIHKKSK